MTYRPTLLKLATRHCPKALDYFEAGVPVDRRVFEAGITAHAILQAVGEETQKAGRELEWRQIEELAEGVCKALIQDGREYEGKQEPAMNPDKVWAGSKVALDYIGDKWLQPADEAHYEIKLAVDERFKATKGAAWMQHTADVVTLEEESGEDYLQTTLTVRDYKSAWGTDAGELETLQRKIGACLAVATFGEPDVLRLEVVNLRSFKHYERLIYRQDFKEQLGEMRREIRATVQALEDETVRGVRTASPGAGCQGCPYLLRCDFAAHYLEETRTPPTRSERARAFAVAHAHAGYLRELVKDDTREEEVVLDDGSVIGFLPQPMRVLKAGAYAEIADEFELHGASVRDACKALALTVGNATKAAQVLHETRERREEWLSGLCETQNKQMLKVMRNASGGA